MIFQVLLAALLGRHKGYRVGKALLQKPFIPFYVVELLYLFFQVNILMQNYIFISYASILKSASLYSLLIPIFIYKLYKPALAGSGCIMVGTLLNRWVIHANGGKMPVYPTLSRLTGYFNDAALKTADSIHILGGADTRLKILSDYIDVGYSVLSIGDVFIHAFVFLIFFYSMETITKLSDGGNKH